MVSILIGILVTPVVVFLAILSGGAGHGDYAFAKLFFPYSMLLTFYVNDTITAPLIVLALVQFPLCGTIIGIAARAQYRLAFVLAVDIAHAFFATICFSGCLPNF
jgi:hypothetical protein